MQSDEKFEEAEKAKIMKTITFIWLKQSQNKTDQ